MATFQDTLWQILETANPASPDWIYRFSRWFDGLIIGLILLNVLALILGSVAEFRLDYGIYFVVFEWTIVMVFTAEYLARVWSCTADPRFPEPMRGRIRFMLRPMSLIDLIAILPFYISAFSSNTSFLRMFRMLRILRLLRISRYSRALRTMLNVLWDSREELAITAMILMFVLVSVSCLVYYVEHPVQPEAFPDIPTTLWWGVVTLTTIGYGDVFPVTTAGRIFTALFAVLGIGVFAIPAGILTSGFVDALQENKGRKAADLQATDVVELRLKSHCDHMPFHIQQAIKLYQDQGMELMQQSDILPCYDNPAEQQHTMVYLHFRLANAA